MHHSITLEDNQTCEIHGFSQSFTGSVYDAIKNEFFSFQQQGYRQDDIALSLAENFTNILVKAVLNVRETEPSFSHVALSMLEVAGTHQNVLGDSFVYRGILAITPIDYRYFYIKGPYENICDSKQDTNKQLVQNKRKYNNRNEFCTLL